jgi:hypothetical protein
MARLLLLCIVLIAALIPSLYQFKSALWSMDESILLVYPDEILDGRWPGIDFFTVYGPGNFSMLALLYALAGPSVFIERLLGFAYHVAIALGVGTLTSRLGRNPSAASAVVSALTLNFVGLPPFAWFGGLALALWSAALIAHAERRGHAFLAGVLVGLVAFWRIEMIILSIPAFLLARDTWGRRAYLQGALVGVFPTVLYVVFSHGEVLTNVFAQRLASNSQPDLSVVPNGVWAGVATVFVIAIGVTVRSIRTRSRGLMATALMCWLVLPQALQRLDLGHLIAAMCLILPIGVATTLQWVAETGSKEHVRTIWRLALVVLAGCFVIQSSYSTLALASSNLATVSHSGRTMPTTDGSANTIEHLVEQIGRHSSPGDEMFVGSTDMSEPYVSLVWLYYLLPEYDSNAYYLEMPGPSAISDPRFSSDIRNAELLVLTRTEPSQLDVEYGNRPSGSKTLNRVIANEFCQVALVVDTTIYRKCH